MLLGTEMPSNSQQERERESHNQKEVDPVNNWNEFGATSEPEAENSSWSTSCFQPCDTLSRASSHPVPAF